MIGPVAARAPALRRWAVYPTPLYRLLGIDPGSDLFSLSALACLRGNRARRADAVLGARGDGGAAPLAGVARRSFLPDGEFGGAEANYLADLSRALGDERFAQFWRSGADVETAFRGAAGESIGAWTARWAADRLHAAPASVPIDAGVALTGLAFAAVATAAGVAAAARRQVR